MRLRVQVRSFDAMCRMIAADLGVGVIPLGTCIAQVKTLHLKAVRLNDEWADRRLLLGCKAGGDRSSAAELLVKHLRASGPHPNDAA
jgi:DNA-binding transcriptional LysR family regulator